MAYTRLNGVEIFHELHGRGGPALVLVHGSWDSHENWRLVVGQLAQSFRVLVYDRRGHSQSERPASPGSVTEDVADLAGLIERLDLAPAWVAGNSFGASISLRLAGARPELLRGVIAHEPPLFALLAQDPATAPILNEIGARIAPVVERIASGDHAGAARRFVDEVALGPGSWAQLSPEARAIFIENAPTFLDEANDPQQLTIDLDHLKGFTQPVLLTTGAQSPPIYAPVLSILADALPAAEIHTFPGAGHIPHVTHADAYAEITAAFIREHG